MKLPSKTTCRWWLLWAMVLYTTFVVSRQGRRISTLERKMALTVGILETQHNINEKIMGAGQ